MILVDVYVPVLNQLYNFKLDENAYIADLVEELGEIIFFKDTDDFTEQMENLILCDYQRQQVFPMNQTLKQNGIGSGCRLVLI